MIVSIACWGDWHTEVFRRFGAPSLLPQLLDGDEIIIHTRADQTGELRAICPLAEVIGDADYFLERAAPRTAHGILWRNDIARARTEGKFIALVWPDVVWGPTVFHEYRRLMGEGKTVSFIHLPRIAVEGAEEKLSRARTNRDLARIAIEHEHDLAKMYYVDSHRYPAYCDMLHWRTDNGVMTRLYAHTPSFFDPLRHGLPENMMLAEPAGDRLGWLGDTDEAIALSLAPAAKEADLALPGNEPSIEKFQKWQAEHFSPASAELAKLSHYLHGTNLRPEYWAEPNRQADEWAAKVFT